MERQQVAGWQLVTDAVHVAAAEWSRNCGTWAGSCTRPRWRPAGKLVGKTAPGLRPHLDGKKPYIAARSRSHADIERIIADYAAAARNAIEAGFDGVQIHGANGYLVDQFLRNSSNFRTDQYGGSIENRLRFATEVIEAVGAEIGMDSVGIRFSPNVYSQGVEDSDPIPLFTSLAHRLEELKVPWIELREAHQPTSAGAIPTAPVSQAMRQIYRGKILINSDYDGAQRSGAVSEGVADGISFGRPFIANPDLVDRIATRSSADAGDVGTFYEGGASGYVDYPTLERRELPRARISRSPAKRGRRARRGRPCPIAWDQRGRLPALRSRP